MLTRLYVNNYRCFVNFELRPGRSNLLLGYNGTGKSSVFDVLAAIQKVVSLDEDVTRAFPSATLCHFGGAQEQRFELDILSEWGEFRYQLHLAHDDKGDVVTIISEHLMLDGKHLFDFVLNEVQLYKDDHSRAKETFSLTSRRSFLASLVSTPSTVRLTWFKEFIAGIFVLRFNPAEMTSLSLSEHEFLTNNASNFSSYARHLMAEDPEGVERARDTLREVIPGFVSLRMQTAGRAKMLVVKFRYPGGKEYELDFDLLSDGQRLLVALYTILYAVPSQARVICLDEPDNFVSIREIQPFLTALADIGEEKGVQSLLISHSAEVIDYIGAAGALLLERPEGGHTRVGSIKAGGPLRLSELMARGWHVES